MFIAAAVFMLIHGIAHLVGFVVPWRLANLPEAPYKTTILAGRIDIGDRGIKAMGIVWLLLALAFAVAAAAILLRAVWWPGYTAAIALVSLICSVLGLPEAKLGIPINIVIIAVILYGVTAGWSFV